MGELVEVSHQLGFQKPDLPCFLDETHPGFRENDRIGRTVKKPDGKVFLQTVDIFCESRLCDAECLCGFGNILVIGNRTDIENPPEITMTKYYGKWKNDSLDITSWNYYTETIKYLQIFFKNNQ